MSDADVIIRHEPDGSLLITYPWMLPKGDRKASVYAFVGVVVCGLFALVGDSVSPTMFVGDSDPIRNALIILVVLAPFGWIAAMARWQTVRIVLRANVLSVRYGPLPWPGGRSVPVHEVAEIDWELLGGGNLGQSRRYGVLFVVSPSGKRRRLVGGLFLSPEQGMIIKQALTAAFGLDRAGAAQHGPPTAAPR